MVLISKPSLVLCLTLVFCNGPDGVETDLGYDMLCLRTFKMTDIVQIDCHVYRNIPSSKIFGLGIK
jgi:hypothetical protein